MTKSDYATTNIETQWTAWYAVNFWSAVTLGMLVWAFLQGSLSILAVSTIPLACSAFELQALRRLKRLLREHRASLLQTQEILSKTTIG